MCNYVRTAAEREGGEVAGTQSVLDYSAVESNSSSSSKCYDNIPSTFFESQLQAKVLEGMQFVLRDLIYNLCTLLLLKDKTKKASKSARAEVSDGDADAEELQSKDKAKAKIPSTIFESQLQSKVLDGMQFVLRALIYNLCTLLLLKDKTKKASKSARAESDGDADSDVLSREELLLKLQKVTKEKKALEKEDKVLRRNNIIFQQTFRRNSRKNN